MSADTPGGAFAGRAAVGLVVCCALPVLLSVGAGITPASVGLRSWALAATGLAALALGVVRFRRHRSCAPLPAADRMEDDGNADPSRTR